MRFEKVSKEAWIKQCNKLNIPRNIAENTYKKIKLPERATSGSCGYDFFCPMDITINHEEVTLIPTGIRVFLDEGYFLLLAARSSCIKQGYTMSNNIGIIDEDYINADNEGNIMVPLHTTGLKEYVIAFKPGDKIAQGIIIPFANIGDTVDTSRTGGFGSTDDNKEKEVVEDNKVLLKLVRDESKELELFSEEENKEPLSNNSIDSLFNEEESNQEEKVENVLTPEEQTELKKVIKEVIANDNSEQEPEVVEEKVERVEITPEELVVSKPVDVKVEAEDEEPVKDISTDEGKPGKLKEALIKFNDHLIIDGNIVNDIIVRELFKMIEFAKVNDPIKFVKFTSLIPKADSLTDISNLYNTVNEWYNEFNNENNDIISDIYLRDSLINLVNILNISKIIDTEEIKKIINLVNEIRLTNSNEAKLSAGQDIYNAVNNYPDEDYKKLFEKFTEILK